MKIKKIEFHILLSLYEGELRAILKDIEEASRGTLSDVV